MKNHRFPWLRNRTTDNRKCEKARNIKEKCTIEMLVRLEGCPPRSAVQQALISAAQQKLYPTAFMASVLVGRRLFYGKKGGFSWPYP